MTDNWTDFVQKTSGPTGPGQPSWQTLPRVFTDSSTELMMMPCDKFPVMRALLIALSLGAKLLTAAESIPTGVLAPADRAIRQVAAGRLDTAKASWWGFDSTDATEALQAALDSPAKTVLVENMDRPWIVTTINLPSDKTIVFEPGTVVEARRGAFLGKSDCLFAAKGQRNLTLRGDGAILRMHKADYHRPPYEPAEWRHALSIRGCENVTVEGLTLKDSGGDGIYLGTGAERATNRDITIRDVICDGNNRQGISVITAENLLIENCVFRDTRGTAPEAGIDFEPNHPEEKLVNCVLRHCRSENNAGHAYHIYLGNMNDTSPPISLRFEDCSSKGCERYSAYVGVANREGLRTVRGSIAYADCRFDADQAGGVYIRGNEAEGCRVRLEGCEIIRRDGRGSRLAPITIEAPRRLDVDAGNVVIQDCLVRDSLARQPIGLIASPISRLRNVSGFLTVENPEGKESFTLDASQLAEWFPRQGLLERIPRLDFDWRQAAPVSADQRAERAGIPFRLRQQATMLVWAEADRPVEFLARVEPIGRTTPGPGTMTVAAPDGKTIELNPNTEEDGITYRFKPTAPGPHRLRWEGDNRATLRILQSTVPVALLSETAGTHLFRPTGTLAFAVPRGVGRFAIQVAGAGTAETVKATIRDATGRVVEEKDNIAPPHVFLCERPNDKQPEIWTLVLDKAREGVLEDVSIEAIGIPPVFAPVR